MTGSREFDKLGGEGQEAFLAPAICRELIRRGANAEFLKSRPVWQGMHLKLITFEWTATKEEAENFLKNLK